MSNPTEETINPIVEGYLKQQGFNVTSERTVKNKEGKTRQIDFVLRDDNGRKFHGEGEWNKTFEKGWSQAIEYGDLDGASGYFVIGYEEELRDTIKQEPEADPEDRFDGHEFRVLFKTHHEGAPAMDELPIEDIPAFLDDALEQEASIEQSVFIDIMQGLVDDLTEYLPDSSDHPALFRNVFPDLEDEESKQGARDASGYVLLNQLIFYRTLGAYGYQPIDPESLDHPTDLKSEYFDRIKGDAYSAVFDVDIVSLVSQQGIDHLRAMVRYVDELEPEDFSSDFLGNTFHSLIPLDVRKTVAAYYTNAWAARLLARLSIQNPDDKIADFACGSGTILIGGYEEKANRLMGDINEDVHEAFVNEQITGVDIMPFAAHLATVQLALRNPGYETHETRIAIGDSTVLEPGDTVRPQQRARGQWQQPTLSEYEGDNDDEDDDSASAAGNEFELEKQNVVAMNPPFTRKQKFGSSYRAELRRRLSDYLDYLNDEIGFYGYFIPLADKFLEDDGRLAMVLPAVLLQQTSLEGIRRLLRDKYTLEHIVLTQYRSAFSEDTSYRDILLVARKDPDGDDPVRLSTLSVLPTENSIDDLHDGLTRDIDGEFENDLLHTVERPQSEFRDSLDWMAHVRKYLDVEFFYDYPDKSRFAPFQDQIDGFIGGLRLERSKEYMNQDHSLISRPRDADVRIDWEITEEHPSGYSVVRPDRGTGVKIPKNVLKPALRSMSGLRTMEVDEAPDHVVMDEFPGDAEFWMYADPDDFLDKRQRHVKSRMGRLVLGGYGNLDVTAPGTSHLAVTAPDEIAPTWSLWSVDVPTEDAKILTLWWNSTYSVAKLITERNEVRGGVMKWRKNDLKALPVPSLDSLTDDERERLLDLYDEVADREFPALVHQFESRFDARRDIDETWNDILDWGYDNEALDTLYDQVASFLTDMKEMMDQD